jgi:RNA polymerase sigma-70 factor (ECF subfamily)
MENWPERLAEESGVREASFVELRSVIKRGVTAGLSGRAGSDEAFIEDVVQQSLVKIVGRLASFEGRGKFTSWALAIALRTAYNELRRKEWKDVSFEELQARQGGLPEERDSAPGPAEEVARRSLGALLRSVIETDLTIRQRDVLLCELNEMPQEEIARQLDTNRNNVYKICHDARKALKRSLESRGLGRASFFDAGGQNN